MHVWTYPVRQKSDVPAVIRTSFSYVHTQFRLPVVAFQTDNGEYDNNMQHALFLQLNTATFLLNRRPCRATGSITPHHLLFGAPPRYDTL
jgi:hypothetical protein